jgi:hypothetical protein
MMEAVMAADRPPLSFLGRHLPPSFERRVIIIAPGDALVYDPAEWRDAIVVVEDGQIELECLDGSRHCFGRGDILWLDGLPLRALHNPGPKLAVLVAVSRRDSSRSG